MDPHDASPAMPRFESELVYESPRAARILMLAISVPFFLGLMALASILLRIIFGHSAAPLPARWFLGSIWFLALASLVRTLLSMRTRLAVGADRITLRNWWHTRAILFPDLAGCTVTFEERRRPRMPMVRGTRLSFQSRRRGASPLAVFIDERVPIDAEIVERLKALPMLSRRALKLLETASTDSPGWD